MKKRIFRIMAVVLLACFGMTAIMACNNSEKKPDPDMKYTVTYVGGEGATGKAPTEASHKEGETFKLKDNTFTKKGFAFTKWNDGSRDYDAGETYTMPAKNVTLTAQWKEAVQYTVTYSLGEYQGTGTAPAAETVNEGSEVTLAAAPTWEGYDFLGWRVGTDLKQAGDKIPVTANITVTAEWERHKTPVDGVWTGKVDGTKLGKAAGEYDVELTVTKEGDGVYYVLKATKGEETVAYTAYLDPATEGYADGVNTLKVELYEVKLTFTKVEGQAFELTARADLGKEAKEVATYEHEDGETSQYVDFAYNMYDDGTGIKDVTYVVIGNYIALYKEVEDKFVGSIVFEAGEKYTDDEITAQKDTTKGRPTYRTDYKTYTAIDENGSETYTCVPSRGVLTYANVGQLTKEGDKVYLTLTGTYPINSFTPKALKGAFEDDNYDDYNISMCMNATPWSRPDSFLDDAQMEHKVHTVNADGAFSVKLDITDVPPHIHTDANGEQSLMAWTILQNNSGWGDLAFSGQPATSVVLGDKKYTLTTANLVVEDYEGDFTITGISLALNTEGDKVILTYKGTYVDYTQAELQAKMEAGFSEDYAFFYFWGKTQKGENGKDIKIEVKADGKWTISMDVTDLKDETCRNLCGGGFGDLKFADCITETVVVLGDKAYCLVKANDWGNNGLNVGPAVTLTYDLGYTEGDAPAAVTTCKDGSVTLAQAPVRDGYDFLGWKVGTDDKGADIIKQPGEKVVVAATMTVTAQWKKWPQPRTDYVGKWTGKVDGTAVGAVAGECDVEIDVLATDEGATLVVRATASEKVLVSSALYIPAHDRAYALGNITLELVDGTLSLANFVDGKTISLTSKATFNKEDEITVTGVYTAAEGAIYLDVDYGAIDMGEGYLDDADYVNIDRFLVPLVEVDETLQGTLVLEKEGEKLVAYGPEGMKLEFAEGTARAKNVVLTTFTLSKAEEEEKVFLTLSGTYVGFKSSELYKLSDDEEYTILNISVFINHNPWTTYPNPKLPATHIVPREHTIGQGLISAKLDITNLPYETYGLAPRNDGASDCKWGSNAQQEIIIGETRWMLSDNYGNAQLTIGKEIDIVANSITIGLDNEDSAQATKVLLTVKGIYSGHITKAEVETILNTATIISFWGSKGQNGTCTTTVEDDGTWTIVVDITNLTDDGDMSIIAGYNGPHKLNNRPGSEFHYDWVVDDSVTFNGKVYSLKKTGGSYAHNCVSVKPVAAE